jgi:hypothetical protein
MTTSTDDSLSSFERDILDELFVAQSARRVAIGTRPPHASAPRHRFAAIASVAAVALAGGAIAATVRSTPRHAPNPAAANVGAHLLDALTHARGDVLHTTEVQRSAGFELQLEQWTTPWDLVPGAAVRQRTKYIQNGTVVQDSEAIGKIPAHGTADPSTFPQYSSIETTGEHIDVRYHDRVWSDMKATSIAFNAPATAATVQHAVASKSATVVGNDTVDGIETIQLRVTDFAGAGSSGDSWVDASTYLPVRMILHNQIGDSSRGTTPGSVQDDFTFLPPTPSNLALLTPVVPAGFTTVASTAGAIQQPTGSEGRSRRRRRCIPACNALLTRDVPRDAFQGIRDLS